MNKFTPEQLAKMPAHLRPAKIITANDRKQEFDTAIRERAAAKRAEIEKASSGIFKHMEAADPTRDSRGIISEEIFKSYFLPMFIDGFADPKNTTPEYTKFVTWRAKILNDWYAITGSEWAEVDVVDAMRNVLFTVPSISSSRMYNPHRDRDAPSAAEITALAGMLGNQSSSRGSVAFSKGLEAKYASMKKKGNIFEKEEQRWLDIRARYPDIQPLSQIHGFAQAAEEQAKPVEQAKPMASDGGDDLVF